LLNLPRVSTLVQYFNVTCISTTINISNPELCFQSFAVLMKGIAFYLYQSIVDA
jgi:hypothetical protein